MSEENVVVEDTQPKVDEAVASEITEQSNATEGVNTKVAKDIETEMFKYKYNHEEKEIPLEEARTLVQKGANYDKIMTKLETLESSPSLKFVEKQAQKNNMSTEEYLDAVAKEEVTSEIARIAETEGVSETVAEKLYKATKLEEKTITDINTAKEKEVQDKHMTDFVKQYPDVKEVPQEVWDRFAEGNISLVDAYSNTSMKSELQELKDKLSKYESQEEISNKNSENAGASTGSVTGNGSTDNLYTRDQVKNMSRAEVNKNYSKIIESQKQWK